MRSMPAGDDKEFHLCLRLPDRVTDHAYCPNGPFLVRKVTADHRIESEDCLCIDLFRRCTTEIESEAFHSSFRNQLRSLL